MSEYEFLFHHTFFTVLHSRYQNFKTNVVLAPTVLLIVEDEFLLRISTLKRGYLFSTNLCYDFFWKQMLFVHLIQNVQINS